MLYIFLLKTCYLVLFRRGPCATLSLLKAICHICAENVEAVAQRNIVIDIVAPHKKRLSTTAMRTSQQRNSEMQSDYAVLELILMVQENPQQE